ncbi:hypothetical protein QBC34DRAFT_397801 [Podospora aff. communis PSN243]|uniref:Uncharacterized protein n=1 Tax=Podospora aff. communis PSN243 TaxID=3040156 RepID=A0AAV9GXB4_9PEZI|nr:hypothetical protein QBC34DRAFT_397801 [Podospora aff. communis PSN243]
MHLSCHVSRLTQPNADSMKQNKTKQNMTLFKNYTTRISHPVYHVDAADDDGRHDPKYEDEKAHPPNQGCNHADPPPSDSARGGASEAEVGGDRRPRSGAPRDGGAHAHGARDGGSSHGHDDGVRDGGESGVRSGREVEAEVSEVAEGAEGGQARGGVRDRDGGGGDVGSRDRGGSGVFRGGSPRRPPTSLHQAPIARPRLSRRRPHGCVCSREMATVSGCGAPMFVVGLGLGGLRSIQRRSPFPCRSKEVSMILLSFKLRVLVKFIKWS